MTCDTWQAHSDVTAIKQLLSACTSHLARVTSFVQDVLASANAGDALHSCRIKAARSLVEKIKKFRSGGSEWGKDATAADVMDMIGDV